VYGITGSDLSVIVLQHQLQPYQEVIRLILEIRNNKTKKKYLKIRVIGHLIAYVEYQFGGRVEGIPYRKRGSGDLIDNVEIDVEIEVLFLLHNNLICIYQKERKSMDIIICDDLIFPYFERCLIF
jgi:hypothetical protein